MAQSVKNRAPSNPARLCPEPDTNSILPQGRPGEEYTEHNQNGSKLAEDGGRCLATLNPLHLRQQDPTWAHRTITQHTLGVHPDKENTGLLSLIWPVIPTIPT